MTIESAIVSVNGKVMGDLDELIKRPTEEFTEAMRGIVERGMPPAQQGITELSTTERAELGRYEAVIKRGLETFVSVGNALLAIRRDRLYRATHATFEAYCEQRWQLTANFAHKLIGAAEVVTNLQSVDNCTVLPANEAQARPLTKLPPDQQVEAWAEAVESAPDGRVTAAHVDRTVKRLHPTTATPTPELTKPVYIEPTPAKPPEPLSPRQIVNTLRTYAVDDSEFADALKLATVEELSRALDGMDAIGDYTRREAIAGQIRTLEPAAPVAAEPTPEVEVAPVIADKVAPGFVHDLQYARIDSETFRFALKSASIEQLHHALKLVGPVSEKERFLKIGNRRELLLLAQQVQEVDQVIEAVMPTPIEQAIAEAKPTVEPEIDPTPDDLAAKGLSIVPSQDGKGWRLMHSDDAGGTVYGLPYLAIEQAIEHARKSIALIETYPAEMIKRGLKEIERQKTSDPGPIISPALIDWTKRPPSIVIAEPVPVDDIRSLINIAKRTSGHKPDVDVIGLVERVERWLGTVIA